ncbi:hypothetical protein GQ42DRAFT_163111 [Ramicandelaber brevisporus]|nr:hypothetical protein GQ42DRAFT_163111 [Ramicandelaber brevisporus]
MTYCYGHTVCFLIDLSDKLQIKSIKKSIKSKNITLRYIELGDGDIKDMVSIIEEFEDYRDSFFIYLDDVENSHLMVVNISNKKKIKCTLNGLYELCGNLYSDNVSFNKLVKISNDMGGIYDD